MIRSLIDDDFTQLPCCVVAMNNKFRTENPPTGAPATKLYSTLLVMGTRREAMWLTPNWAAPVPRASLMAVPLRHWTWMPYSSK